MYIRILLLFVATVFADDIDDANRVDIDHMGPVFPFDAFGIGYEDFISKIHPPLLAAMNYRPVMPHDITQYVSDGQVTSIALSSKSDSVVKPSEEATKSESFTSATLEALPSPFEEPGSVSFTTAAPELANSKAESCSKTFQESVGTETREESVEDIDVETEDDSEKKSETETPEDQISEKASILSKDSIFTSDTENKSSETEGSSFSKEKPLSDSGDKSKDSAEKEFTDESAGKTSSNVHESEDPELKKSESSKIRSQEFRHVSSKESEIKKSGESPDYSSGDDYHYYTIDYEYDEREVSESNDGPWESISDDVLMTSSYEYSDTTTTPEYYSSKSIQSEETVFIFPESHQIKDTSGPKEEEFVQTSHSEIYKGQSFSTESNEKRESDADINSSSKSSETSGTFKERGSDSTISKPASSDSGSQTPSSVPKPTQVSSESASTDIASENSPSSSSMRKQSESDSAKMSFSANIEAAASTSFPTSSKSSEQRGKFLNKPQVMEEGILLRDAIEVYGQKLDLESMRKIIEHSYTELSSLRKKLTRKQNVLSDLNQVIDELQKLCQAICVTVPEQYLMTDSDAKSSMVKTKLRSG